MYNLFTMNIQIKIIPPFGNEKAAILLYTGDETTSMVARLYYVSETMGTWHPLYTCGGDYLAHVRNNLRGELLLCAAKSTQDWLIYGNGIVWRSSDIETGCPSLYPAISKLVVVNTTKLEYNKSEVKE